MLRRHLLAPLLAVLLAAVPLAATHADEQTTTEPVVVVMDYSSSMLEKDADAKGTKRIDAAKTAAKSLIASSPEDATMGLVVYGSKSPGKCDDITTVQKPGAVDKKKLSKKIDELKAVGETPIGASLLHAAKDLEGIEGPKSIILVSDGEENCDKPPACEAAKDLAGQGIALTVHTIGFKVNDKARQQLECISETTGGSYVDVDDAQSLEEELTSRTLRAFQGYSTAGTPIEGGARLHEAPLMVPGQYLDELEKGETDSWNSNDGTTKYYKIGPLQPGQYAHFSATMIPEQKIDADDDDPAKVIVELVNGQGSQCSSGDSYTVGSDELGRPLAAYTRSPEFVQDSSYGCFADGTGELFAKVTREGSLFHEDPMAVELRYVLEPAVDAALLGAPASEEDKPQSVTLTGTPEPVLGGSSFNDALPVKSGTIYSDSVLSSEARYYKVHVGNGQKLNLRLTSGNNEDASAQAVTMGVYSPVRDGVDMLGTGRLHESTSGETITRSMRTAVDQSNYDSYIGRSNYLAGDYYVVIYSDTWMQKANGVPYDYELAVDVTGTEKEFAGAAPIFEASEMPSASPEAGATESETATEAEAAPASSAAPSPSESEPQAETAPAASSAPLWPWFTGGLVGTAALLGAGTFLFRNRATTAHEHSDDIDPTVPGGRP